MFVLGPASLYIDFVTTTADGESSWEDKIKVPRFDDPEIQELENVN